MPRAALQQLHDRLTAMVIGSGDAATLLLTALLARGHVLIEGAPGIGKTTLAHTLASSIGGAFKRVQFTPDLLPSDLLGFSLYRMDRGAFEFIPGPVFANCRLADEINRASPRVQSALLESMNEGRVSLDGETALISPAEILSLQQAAANVPVAETIANYITALCQTLRRLAGSEQAVSIRASLAVMQAARAHAFLEGKPAVHPDHVQAVFPAVMRHRVIPDDGGDATLLIAAAMERTPVP